MTKETRMNEADVARLKAMFADNEDNLKVLRKLFYPELCVENPLGMNFDLWSTTDLSGLSVEQAHVMIEARKMMINHVEGVLRMMQTLAGKKDESPEDTLKRLMKDSAK